MVSISSLMRRRTRCSAQVQALSYLLTENDHLAQTTNSYIYLRMCCVYFTVYQGPLGDVLFLLHFLPDNDWRIFFISLKYLGLVVDNRCSNAGTAMGTDCHPHKCNHHSRLIKSLMADSIFLVDRKVLSGQTSLNPHQLSTVLVISLSLSLKLEAWACFTSEIPGAKPSGSGLLWLLGGGSASPESSPEQDSAQVELRGKRVMVNISLEHRCQHGKAKSENH